MALLTTLLFIIQLLDAILTLPPLLESHDQYLALLYLLI
jgi:hypothetical protein